MKKLKKAIKILKLIDKGVIDVGDCEMAPNYNPVKYENLEDGFCIANLVYYIISEAYLFRISKVGKAKIKAWKESKNKI